MRSLRFKIIASTLLIVFLIIAGSYLVIQDIQTGIIEGEFREKGFLLANHLALEVSTPLLVNDLIEIRNSIEDIKNSYPDVEYIFVTDAEGIVLMHTFEKGFPKALLDRSNPSSIVKEYVFETEKGIIHEFDAPAFKNIGYVHVGVSEKSVRAQILEASRKLLLLAVSAMVLCGVFISFIGRRLTEPVLKLTEGANRINKGILDQKIIVNTRDELGELATTFNDMASSLDQKIKEIVASKEQTEAAEKYLETLFDSIEDGIFVVNINHEIIKVNKSFLKIMGMSEEKVLGRSCHEVIFGSMNRTECQIDRLLQTKVPERFVHEVYVSGNKKILELNPSLFFDKKGTVNLIVVLRDVTQQKILEGEIIRRNKELTVINEISKTISETFDLDRILSSSLDSLLKLTGMESGSSYLVDENSGGFSLKVHRGKEENIPFVQSITGEENPAKDALAVRMLLKSKENIMGMIELRSREAHSFSERDRELFHSIGNQLGIAVENITFYNNIKYLKDFNEEILNNVNLAIHVVDKDMKLLAVNDELIKLSRGRLKKEQLINKSFFEAFPFLKQLEKEYRYVIETGEIFLSEEKTNYYDEEIYTSTSKIPIKDGKGNVEKVITVIKDVSDQKKLEEELKDSYEELKLTYSKLKELYKLKDNFLSNISHELRTPLTSVIGYTELILEENLTQEQRHKLEIILRNSKRLSKLIRALLDTTLIESNNLQLDMQMLEINELLASVAEDMRTMAATKNLPIRIDIPELLVVRGDRDRLLQVFSNVVENAIKFTITGEITMKAATEDEFVHVKISDTGIGIPEDKLDAIFDKFYQLDETNTRRFGGAGLGLWISKNIVEAHGGRIWAESKNRGSTFHVLLPKTVKE